MEVYLGAKEMQQTDTLKVDEKSCSSLPKDGES